MGIYYLTGLGTSPGAAAVPLHYIYLMIKAAEKGNEKAITFFKKSGEIRHDQEEYPECVILFTSKEVIREKIGARSDLIDNWFKIGVRQINSVPRIFGKSILSLIEACNFQEKERALIDDIYLVEVDHTNFRDCYKKIYTTIQALERKELWVSYLAGSNQINLSLFLASALTGHPSKYIYVSQDNISKIHPDIPRPDFDNPQINIPPDAWDDLPFIWLGIESKILQDIENVFKWKNEKDDIINKGEIEEILRKNNLSNQFLAKFQSGDLFQIEGEKVIKGAGFKRIKKYIFPAEPENFAEWKKWAIHNNLLYKINLFENCVVEKCK